MAIFKGRVVKVERNIVIVDRTAGSRKIGTEVVGSSWSKGDTPKVGAVVRCNFHNKDKV